jgi:hypothetical protein
MGCWSEAVECHDYFLHKIIDLSICVRNTKKTEGSIAEKDLQLRKLFWNSVELNFQNCEKDPAWTLKPKKGEATFDAE